MIEIKTESEIKNIALACKAVSETLKKIEYSIKPGISTLDIDIMAANNLALMKAKPAFLGYRGYPSTVCVSVNEQVIHGIPSKDKILSSGDVVSVDLGAIVNGFYGDAAITIAVGEAAAEDKLLIETTRLALAQGLKQIKNKGWLGDVSSAIEKFAQSRGFSVVKDFTGHGIGRRLHEEPSIPNFGVAGTGPMLRTGMTLAIEPMVCAGKEDVKFLSDGWTVVTKDGKKAAHFEHTVAVGENGCEILT